MDRAREKELCEIPVEEWPDEDLVQMLTDELERLQDHRARLDARIAAVEARLAPFAIERHYATIPWERHDAESVRVHIGYCALPEPWYRAIVTRHVPAHLLDAPGETRRDAHSVSPSIAPTLATARATTKCSTT